MYASGSIVVACSLSLLIKPAHHSPQSILLIYLFMKSVGRFPFPTLSLEFIVCRLLDNDDCEAYEEIPHYNFDLHFSNI